MQAPTGGDNRLTLVAMLAERADLRYTPAGIAAVDCVLAHRSMQREAEGDRNVECELHAVAFGDIATRLTDVRVGSTIRCEGFLARRYRTGTTLALHITRFTNEGS